MALTKIGVSSINDTFKTAISGSTRGEFSSSVHLRQVATTISGSLGANAAVIRSLDRTTISGSIPQALATTSSPTFAAGTITGDFSVGGILTAQEVHTEFESASILFTSGSTRFGDDTTDTHRVTGSMDISGSFKIPHGDVTITDNLDVDGTTNLDVVDIDGNVDVELTASIGKVLVDGNKSSPAAPGLAFDNDTDTGLAWGGTNAIGIITGGTRHIEVRSNGEVEFAENVGIGTTDPDGRLDVRGGNVNIDPDNQTSQAVPHSLFINKDGDPTIGFAVRGNGSGASIAMGVDDSDSDKFKISTHPTDIGTAANLALSIDSSRNIGIGTATADRNSRLHVSASATGGSDSDVLITNTKTTAQFHRGLTVLHPNISNTNSGMIMFGNAESSGNSGHISFVNNASDGSESIRIGIFAKDDLVTVTGAGDVSIADGNLIIGTSGHGIDFSATSDATGMETEVLDDYEEGSYTPTSITDSLTFSSAVGRYTKIGRICFVRIAVTYPSNSGGSTPRISLPFTAKSDSVNPIANVFPPHDDGVSNAANGLIGRPNGNQAFVELIRKKEGSDADNSDLSGVSVAVTIWYTTTS